MVADEYLQEGNLTISTNIFMVTPRECRKIDINVGVGVVSISHLAHKHTYIHRAVGDYKMASCIGSMPMYLILVKALCRCVDFARFSFVVFHFSIRKSAYRMAICVSRIFTYFTVHFLIHILSYYRFIIHRPPPHPSHPLALTLTLTYILHRHLFHGKFSKFPLNTMLRFLIVPTISSQSTPQSNSLWISCLSVVCVLCARTILLWS